MLFTHDLVPGLADGSITLTFRTWKKPQARVGGHYKVAGLLLEVDAVGLVDPAAITDAEARRAGNPSAEALRDLLDKQGHCGRVWRVQFRCVGADPRIALRDDDSLDAEKLARLEAHLERLDRAAGSGAWTTKTLQLIASHPGVVSTVLAQRMNMDRPAFKINVRKLKELGLTESLEVGYRLSPLGKAYLEKSAGK